MLKRHSGVFKDKKMALVLTLSALPVPHDRTSFEFQDRYKREKSVVITTNPAATLGDLVVMATAMEAASYGKICHIVWKGGDYLVTGGKVAATAGSFDSVNEFATYNMSQNLDCTIATEFRIPAPLEATLTGTEKRLVDGLSPLVTALVAAWQVIYLNPRDGSVGAGYSFDHGTRGQTKLTTVNVF
jgi:hypothetical protein